MNLTNNLKLLSGDASFRKFYRKKNNKKSSLVVFSKKEKKINLLIYDGINKILIKNKIKEPNLLSQNYLPYLFVLKFMDEPFKIIFLNLNSLK